MNISGIRSGFVLPSAIHGVKVDRSKTNSATATSQAQALIAPKGAADIMWERFQASTFDELSNPMHLINNAPNGSNFLNVSDGNGQFRSSTVAERVQMLEDVMSKINNTEEATDEQKAAAILAWKNAFAESFAHGLHDATFSSDSNRTTAEGMAMDAIYFAQNIIRNATSFSDNTEVQDLIAQGMSGWLDKALRMNALGTMANWSRHNLQGQWAQHDTFLTNLRNKAQTALSAALEALQASRTQGIDAAVNSSDPSSIFAGVNVTV